MIRKMIFFTIVLFATSVVAENESTYDPMDGSVELPEVVFLGQEQGIEYLVKMQQREGLNFEVLEATPDEEGLIDSDENRVTYNPESGLVEIPLIFVRSIEDPEIAIPYSVMMQRQEDSDLFEAFDPVEISFDDIDAKFASQSVSPKNRVSLKKSTSKVIRCVKTIYYGGRVRSTRHYFWRKDCPAGWHEV
ncbi:MAG: hypothetical protein V3U87_18110 [Methylococcaceae bacterium]